MLRLTVWTLVGLVGALYVFGDDLSPQEQAERDARRDGREPVMASVRAAFGADSQRMGDYVPTLAELREMGTEPEAPEFVEVAAAGGSGFAETSAPVLLARYAPEGDDTTIGHVTTAASDPEKMANLVQPSLEEAEPLVLRVVSGNRVNVRSGPSTSNEVLGQVVKADIVQVLSSPYAEWVKISVQGGGVEGYMSARFLKELDQ